jgi:UV DNA damage endonuclease
MKLGFAVKVLGEGGLPSHDARRWQSEPHLRVSLEYLDAILGYLDRHDLRMYRMVSQLAPYATHPDLPQFHHQIDECATQLARVGARALELDIRLSTHPGQYTVLNSENPDVVDSAVAELDMQAALLDAMGQPAEAIVVVHVGGAAGGLDQGADRFVRGFERLSQAARRRLVIENDDRTYDLSDVLALSERTGAPVVWDALHHHCNDRHRIPDDEALRLALDTWAPGVTPKIHYSSPRLDMGESVKQVGRTKVRKPVMPDLRNHADLIDPIAFEAFLVHAAAGSQDFDVMLEAKAKDLAALRLRDQLAARDLPLAA